MADLVLWRSSTRAQVHNGQHGEAATAYQRDASLEEQIEIESKQQTPDLTMVMPRDWLVTIKRLPRYWGRVSVAKLCNEPGQKEREHTSANAQARKLFDMLWRPNVKIANGPPSFGQTA